MSVADDWLGHGGLLEQRLLGFRPREAQLAMAGAVEQALADGRSLLVEAGTGTGKTYAYLIPAIASGQRVLVSTGTKNLQDQLYHRDLPQVLSALGAPLRTALLKGRANYLCHYRLSRAQAQPGPLPRAQALARIAHWSRSTGSGDLGELGSGVDIESLRPQVTSTSENCLGNRCPDYNDCFVAKARRQALGAELVVINHHLLFADHLLREDGFGELLGTADAIIVDEAHQLPTLAAQFFGQRVSVRQWRDLARDVTAEAEQLGDLPDLVASAGRLTEATQPLVAVFARPGPQRRTLVEFRRLPGAEGALAGVREALAEVESLLRPLEERNAELASLLGRALDLGERSALILDASDEDQQVRWVEASERGGSLHATPIAVADDFRRMRDRAPGCWVLTSATLGAQGRFEHFASQLGLEDSTQLSLESPFDYPQQACLWVPRQFPEPSEPGHSSAVAALAARLAEAGDGGLFVLCTSRRAVREIAAQLRETLPGRALLVQDEDGKSRLLSRFADDGRAVLVGTSSFWEGVDVRGRALRVVIIDKLPFAPPGDPVFEARRQALRSQGKDPFREQQLPEAIMTLRQGVGRLIRDPGDRGLMVIADPRLHSKGYGRQVLASLPPMTRLDNESEALEWVRTL